MKKLILLFSFATTFNNLSAQSPEESELGAWYMYFFQKRFGDSRWGLQGDYQLRLWEPAGDLEQLLLRTGFTYRPASNDVMFTLGYAHVRSGAPGDSDDVVPENRIYQEALLPQTVARRFFLTHRFRYEQRWVEGQDFRTRFRYNLFMNIPLNKKEMEPKALYAALYNEIFINGETHIGNNQVVPLFDRNRSYLGAGFAFSISTRAQAGWMRQKTSAWSKGQLQLSLHQVF